MKNITALNLARNFSVITATILNHGYTFCDSHYGPDFLGISIKNSADRVFLLEISEADLFNDSDRDLSDTIQHFTLKSVFDITHSAEGFPHLSKVSETEYPAILKELLSEFAK